MIFYAFKLWMLIYFWGKPKIYCQFYIKWILIRFKWITSLNRAPCESILALCSKFNFMFCMFRTINIRYSSKLKSYWHPCWKEKSFWNHLMWFCMCVMSCVYLMVPGNVSKRINLSLKLNLVNPSKYLLSSD